ncbi:hypothetical protein [Asaia bogorensis]|uniref:hypothetical protein n=1 Tax=Asaia bogorensis TaxID=91915 RepID=UPI000EFCCC3D|nr:hypothetical protein [Asaia bogorensis]
MTTPPPPVSRVLMAAVIGMGVMIVIGTAGLIGVVVHRAMHPHQATLHETRLPSSPMPGESDIVAPRAGQKGSDRAAVFTLHGGGHVLSQTVRPDGSLSLLIATPEGEQIVIWSPESNRVMARFALTP